MRGTALASFGAALTSAVVEKVLVGSCAGMFHAAGFGWDCIHDAAGVEGNVDGVVGPQDSAARCISLRDFPIHAAVAAALA